MFIDDHCCIIDYTNNCRKSDKRCDNRNFKPVPKSAACKDYQEIKIQEHVHKLGMGSIPRAMLLILQDDLVDKVGHASFIECVLIVSTSVKLAMI
jgi:DNA replicative helicase MCM subunit Mcm2 (Cdc46/Mcm family)